MSQEKSFIDHSYNLHELHLKEMENGKKDPLMRLKIEGSIDYWRHERIYEMLRPLMNPGGSWLTVGDGIGTDGAWLEKNKMDVIASDIGDTLLKKAQEQGFVSNISRQNAEALTYNDNTFDYVLCKEAYHHFPRPYLAVYEMLRASNKGIILIEPQDPIMSYPLLLLLKNIIYHFNHRWLRKFWKNQYSFEEVGNYVYKISEREIEKIAMGIGYPAIAVAGINHYYNNAPSMAQVPANPAEWNKAKRKVAFKDLICKWGIVPYGLMCCIIFKTTPDQQTISDLQKKGFRYIELPPNPYAQR